MFIDIVPAQLMHNLYSKIRGGMSWNDEAAPDLCEELRLLIA